MNFLWIFCEEENVPFLLPDMIVTRNMWLLGNLNVHSLCEDLNFFFYFIIIN